MRVLSAVQAIQPAIDRTRELLSQRRSIATFFKITLIGTLAALGNSFNFRLGRFTHTTTHTAHPALPPQLAPFIAAMAAFGVLIAIVLGLVALVLFYVGNRCEFVLFDMVLMRRTEAGPGWRMFARRTWRWLGAKLAVLLAFSMLLLLLTFPLVMSFVRASRAHQPIHWGAMMSSLVGSVVGLFVVFLVFYVVFTLMHDFLLPAVALEDAPVFASFGRLASLVRTEPGEIALYLVLRIAIAFLLGIVMLVAVIIVGLVLGLLLGAIGAVLFAALRHSGVAGLTLLGVAIGLEVLLLLAAILLTYVAVAGSFMVFQQSWALYFLGGRYTLLGNLLEPPVAYAPPVAAAMPPYPAAPPFAPGVS